MIDASSSQVVLRVTAQMLQLARALAVDEGGLGGAGLDWRADGLSDADKQRVLPPNLGSGCLHMCGRQRTRATLDVSSALSCSAFLFHPGSTQEKLTSRLYACSSDGNRADPPTPPISI